MPRGTLNLGILAHVDAGKTSLTERLLYCAGVIDEPGSVDEGTTRTDSLALERQRGITIKSAVVSFTVDGTSVNLIDTPGHPDFVAEVERALSVLDGVVLVVSAVEGVQPQTRILWRALERLRVPTLFFVNKIDRLGAGYERLLDDIAERLTPAIIPMGSVTGLGKREAAFIPDDGADPATVSRLAEALAEHDDAVLAAYLDDQAVTPDGWVRRKLAAQVKDALVHPVFFGSAITGAGVDVLLRGLAGLLPASNGPSARARRKKSCTRRITRSSPRSASGLTPHPRALASGSASRSAIRACRSTSTRTRRASPPRFGSMSPRRCARACTAGRSPTARSR